MFIYWRVNWTLPRPLRLFLVAQYYAALKYAAESVDAVRVRRNGRRRRVYLMPLGGVDGWVWGAVAKVSGYPLVMTNIAVENYHF